MSGITFAVLFVFTTIVVDVSRVYSYQPTAIELLDQSFEHIALPHHVRYVIKTRLTNYPAIASMALSLLTVLAIHIGGWLCSLFIHAVVYVFSWMFALVSYLKNSIICIALKLSGRNQLIESIIDTNRQILEILEQHDQQLKTGSLSSEQRCDKALSEISHTKRIIQSSLDKQASALSGHKKQIISFAEHTRMAVAPSHCSHTFC